MKRRKIRIALIAVAVFLLLVSGAGFVSYRDAIRVANAYVAGAEDGPFQFVMGRFVVLMEFEPCWVLRYDNDADDRYTRIYVNLTGTEAYNVRGLSPVPLIGKFPPSRWYGPGGTRVKDTTTDSTVPSEGAPSDVQ
ncbi:hypothetical protein ACFLQU_04890 [Verrucomicrobiota bacterium]